MNTIKQKILALPLTAHRKIFTPQGIRQQCAEVAQEYVDKLELAEKYNFEVIQEINAGLEQQLLAERAKMESKEAYYKSVFSDGGKQIQKHKNNIEALIAEIKNCRLNADDINTILDKWSTK